MGEKVRNLYAEGYLNRALYVFNSLRAQCTGFSYDLYLCKKLKYKKSHKSLLDAYFYCKKHLTDKGLASVEIDIYLFLKEVLEANIPLPPEHEKMLFDSFGIKRDFSGLNKSQEDIIKLQSAGIAFWLLKKERIGLIEEVAEELFQKNNPLYTLLVDSSLSKGVWPLFTIRTARNHLAEIFALPRNVGRRSEKQAPLIIEGPIVIPGIFLKNSASVNFPKLRWVVTWITISLRALGCSLEQIKNSELIASHIKPLRAIFSPVCEFLIQDWVTEAFYTNAEFRLQK
jgi:hypothetical protein